MKESKKLKLNKNYEWTLFVKTMKGQSSQIDSLAHLKGIYSHFYDSKQEAKYNLLSCQDFLKLSDVFV